MDIAFLSEQGRNISAVARKPCGSFLGVRWI
jgi:hypothetical protein